MAELKWRTPVPLPGLLPMSPENTQLYLIHLARWLLYQEREKEYDLEPSLIFGGPGVAEKIFGFEHLWTGYAAAPQEYVALAAPTGAKKKIIIAMHIHIEANPGTATVILRKAGVDIPLADVATGVGGVHEDIIQGHTGYITLDASDESLVVEVLTGNSDISWTGSYVDVD